MESWVFIPMLFFLWWVLTINEIRRWDDMPWHLITFYQHKALSGEESVFKQVRGKGNLHVVIQFWLHGF